MDDDLLYLVSIRFNSRTQGAKQCHISSIRAKHVVDAIKKGIAAAVRLPEHGQSIFVTGATADEIR